MNEMHVQIDVRSTVTIKRITNAMMPVLKAIRNLPAPLAISQKTRRLIYALILGIFLLVCAVSYWTISQFIDYGNQIRRTHHAFSEISGTLVALNDVEDIAQEFLVTGNTNLIARFNAATTLVTTQLTKLRDLTANDPAQQQRLAILEPLVVDRTTLLNRLVTKTQIEIIPYPLNSAIVVGQIPANERSAINAMSDAENSQLTQLEDQSNTNAQSTLLLASISALSGMALFLLIFFLLNREITVRQEMVASLRASEQRLRTQFKGIPIPTYIWRKIDDDLVLVDYNDSAEKLSRGGVARLVGLKVQEVHKDQPEMAENIWRCIEQQKTIQFDTYYQFQTINERKNLVVTCVPVNSDTILVHTEDVTERKRTEEVLKYERNLMRTVIDNLPDYIFAKDRAGRFIFGNIAHNRASNVSDEQIIGKTALEVFPRDLAERFTLDDSVTMDRAESLINAERQTLDAFGQRGWVLTTKVPLRNSDGEVIGLVGISRNITERKQIERELSQYRNELENLIAERTLELTTANQRLSQGQEQLVRITDNMQDIICQIDLQGFIQYISPSCANVLGYSAEVLSGSSIFSGVHPDDLEPMKAGILRGERTVYRYRHRDGHYLWLETLSNLLVEPDTNAKGIILATRDITIRTQIEQALQQSEERFRQLAENIDDMFWMTSPDYKDYIYVSPAYEKIWGRSCASLYQLATSILDAIHPDDIERVMKAMRQPASYGYDEQYRIVKPDGALRWIHTRAFPIRNEAGDIYRLAGISNDISDQKLLEQELQNINHLKTEFLSTAAHELRTPLASVVGFSELLLTREIAADRSRHFIEIIHEQSIQLQAIIDTLLDITRLEAKQAMALDLKPIDMAALVTKIQSHFAEYSPKYNFQVDGLTSYPPILGDALRLGQVLQNVLSNAIKYSPNGGTITIAGQMVPGFVQLSLRDHGIGMSRQQQAHLFERFYRADASNTTISGSGLSLAICKLIIELHGGKIWIESEPMVGTVVYLTLPLSPRDS